MISKYSIRLHKMCFKIGISNFSWNVVKSSNNTFHLEGVAKERKFGVTKGLIRRLRLHWPKVKRQNNTQYSAKHHVEI